MPAKRKSDLMARLRKCNAAAAQELLSEMVEIVVCERGAFLEEADA